MFCRVAHSVSEGCGCTNSFPHLPLNSGHELTPATGFAALALFNLLRSPLMMFPDVIGNLVRGRISMTRIQAFLDTGDVRGLPHRAGGGGSSASAGAGGGAGGNGGNGGGGGSLHRSGLFAAPSRMERSNSATSQKSNSSGMGPAR